MAGSTCGMNVLIAAACLAMAASAQAQTSHGLGVQTGGRMSNLDIGFGVPRSFGLYGGWDRFGRWRGAHGYPWRGWPGTYRGPVIVGTERRLDPALFADPDQEVAPPPTRGERVLDLLSSRRYADAAEAIRRPPETDPAVESPGPAPDPRLLAVALTGQGKLADAAIEMEAAYLADPSLAGVALDGGAIASDVMELRRLVNAGVAAAQRNPSGGAWLLVAVLMQAEGRDAVAGRMLLRAAELGLDSVVAQELGASLGVKVGEGA